VRVPKITNWSKRSEYDVPRGFEWAWDHDLTDEVVAVTEKVPNDGYYVLSFRPDEKVRQGNGERVGYSHVKADARRRATHELREHPFGFVDQEIVRKTLRELSGDERLRLLVDDDEYFVYLAGSVLYEAPDQYGAGSLTASIEFNTEAHEVRTDEIPSQTGEIAAHNDYSGHWEDTTLKVWNPVEDPDEPGLVTDHEWITLGTIQYVDVLDEEEEEGES
jgi:hypothetical protein